MFCQDCGMEVASNYKMCPKCGGKGFGPNMIPGNHKANTVQSSPVQQQAFAQPVALGINHQYASFWQRLGAYLLDGLLITGVPLVLLLPVIAGGFVGESGEAIVVGWMVIQVIGALVTILYYSLMHSSKYQATLGKKWLGLRVVDEQGQRISVWRALGRFFALFLSMPLFLGFLMVFFTEHRQALHDKIAGTRVLYVGR